MRFSLSVRQIVLVSCFLLLSPTACVWSETETVVPATRRVVETSPRPATATMTRPELPATVVTATIMATVAATATPVPTFTPTAAAAPADPLVIAPENAERLTQLAQFGNGIIKGISWSPDGATFALASSTGIHLYDEETLQEVGTLGISTDYMADFSFSPQGDVLVVYYCDLTCAAGLWDITSNQALRDLDTWTMPVFTPDGQTVMFGHAGGTQVELQDVRTGESQHTTMSLDLAPGAWPLFSPSLATVVEMGVDGTVRLWDTASGQLRNTFDMLVSVDAVQFSPQEDLLAVSGADSIVRVWDVQSGELLHELAGHVVFSPDGRILATASPDRTVRVWDRQSGQLLHLLEGHSNIIFSPDGRIMLTFSEDSTAHMWDTASMQLLHMLTPPTGPDCSLIRPSVAFSPDGSKLAVVSGDDVMFFDVASGALRGSIERYSLTTNVAFTSDSSALVAGSGCEVLTLDVGSGEALQIQQSDEVVGNIALSPNGLMAWGGGGQQYWLQVWDRTTEQLLYTIEEEVPPVNEVAFSPDGQLLATQSGYEQEAVVQVREAGSGRLLFNHEARRFAFSPDGRLFATSLELFVPAKATIELWDTTTFQLVRRLEKLTLLAFGADGKILAKGARATGWWDPVGGELVHPLEMTVPPFRAISLSPDGRLLLGIPSAFPYLPIWDTATGRELWSQTFAGTGTFSPDGRLLATVSQGVVYLWGLPSGAH